MFIQYKNRAIMTDRSVHSLVYRHKAKNQRTTTPNSFDTQGLSPVDEELILLGCHDESKQFKIDRKGKLLVFVYKLEIASI